jgi:DNA-directed RNA polymerase sigma subunit (sigma70/sigma32)
MNKDVTDLELVENLQNNEHTQDSLNLLVERHSGIYLDMVNSYASPNNPFIDYEELIADKEYKIYNAAIKYNKDKGAKFSTYLGNETKWMCLNIYNRNKRRPAFQSSFIENLSSTDHMECDTISESIKKDLFDKVLSAIKMHPDKRVERIFEMRYIIGNKNKVMPWKKIGEEMKLSIQGCINIHNSVVQNLKEELKQEI